MQSGHGVRLSELKIICIEKHIVDIHENMQDNGNKTDVFKNICNIAGGANLQVSPKKEVYI